MCAAAADHHNTTSTTLRATLETVAGMPNSVSMPQMQSLTNDVNTILQAMSTMHILNSSACSSFTGCEDVRKVVIKLLSFCFTGSI